MPQPGSFLGIPASYTQGVNTARMDEILSLLRPEEMQEALWLVGLFEQWNMPVGVAGEWRRRIVARQRFLAIEDTAAPNG